MMVKSELEKLGLKYLSVKIGEADIKESLTPKQRDQFNFALKNRDLSCWTIKKVCR
jgi:hypothetical protein